MTTPTTVEPAGVEQSSVDPTAFPAAIALSTTLTWPAESFYWAQIDAMGWSGTGELPVGLLPVLAEELPVSIEHVHAVGVPTSDGRVLVCACTHTQLAEVDPGCVELKPLALPHGLDASIEPGMFNLLVGAFEPTGIRQTRYSRHLQLAATLTLCSLVLSIGLMRRSWHAESTSAQAVKASSTLLADFTSDRKDETLSQQAKVMQSIADTTKRAKLPIDAAAGLESLLRVWPATIPAKPISVSVGTDGISLGVVVEGDPAPFLQALKPPDGFIFDEPRINAAGTATRLAIHARYTSGATTGVTGGSGGLSK